MKSKFGHLADGSPAWRCRKHRKGWTPVEDTPGNATALGPMPSKLETKADMDRAYRWLMRASDHLNAAQVKNRLMILNARNKLRARMDEELVDAYRDLHDICTLLIGRYMKTRSEPVDPELEYFIEQYEQWRAKKDTKEAAWLADNELAQHVVSDRQKRATADAKVAKEQRKAAQAERARDMDSDPDDPDYDTGAPSPQHQRGAE